jgi:copper(I)-binding protein
VIRSSRTPAGRRLLVLAIAALIPALAGCEAGTNAPTQEWHQPTDGTGTVHDDISIRNVFVLGAAIGSTIKVGGSAGVFLALINNGSADKLVKISAPGTAKSVTLPGGSVSLASQKAVLLTGPAPKVILEGLIRPLTGGSTVRLVLTFQNASSVSMAVPVMPRAQYYSTFSPPSPSPSATPKGKKSSASPSPSASASASPSPSASS